MTGPRVPGATHTHTVVTLAGVPVRVPVASIPCPSCGSSSDECRRPAGPSREWHPTRMARAVSAAREVARTLEGGRGWVVRRTDGATDPRAVWEGDTRKEARDELVRQVAAAVAAGAVLEGVDTVRYRYGYRSAWVVARAGEPAEVAAEVAPAPAPRQRRRAHAAEEAPALF